MQMYTHSLHIFMGNAEGCTSLIPYGLEIEEDVAVTLPDLAAVAPNLDPEQQ
jgi:hypothetical protein